MKIAVKVISTILLGILLISCPLLQRDYSIQDPGDDVEIPDGFGAVEINFGTGLEGTKNLPLPVTMDIGSYTVSGTLDGGGDSFNVPVQAGGSFTRSGLTPGLWTITVDALSTDVPAVTIGRGTTTAQIIAGAITTVQVTITPLTRDGVLDVTVQWSKEIFKKDERVDATLTPTPPYGTLIVTDPGTGGAYRHCTISGDPIPAGYYLLTLELFVNDVLQKTMIEVARILADQTTSGTLTFPLE